MPVDAGSTWSGFWIPTRVWSGRPRRRRACLRSWCAGSWPTGAAAAWTRGSWRRQKQLPQVLPAARRPAAAPRRTAAVALEREGERE
eukprot:4451265-Prymnesium_polylepis.1